MTAKTVAPASYAYGALIFALLIYTFGRAYDIISLEMIASAAKTVVVAGGSIYLLDVGFVNIVIYQKNQEISRLTADLAELSK